MTQQAFTIGEFGSIYKLGKTTVYEEIGAGRLATYKVGRRRYVSARAAAEWQRHLEADADAGEAQPHSCVRPNQEPLSAKGEAPPAAKESRPKTVLSGREFRAKSAHGDSITVRDKDANERSVAQRAGGARQ